MADVAAPEAGPAHGAPYPAKTRTATGTVNSVPTEVEVSYFRDKILVLVSQSGRLAQWVCLFFVLAALVFSPPSLRSLANNSDPSTTLRPLRCFRRRRPPSRPPQRRQPRDWSSAFDPPDTTDTFRCGR